MDEKIEKAIEPLVTMYEEIENELLNKIASHFLIKEEFLNSDYWRIKKLEEMGLFNQEVIKYLSKSTKSTKKKILKALNEIGIASVNYDKYKKLFEDEQLKINPEILKNNYTISNIINFAFNELSNHFIQMSSKIDLASREAYLNVVESAYLKTSMGTHSYQEAIREAINDLSNKGLTVLTYQTTDENGNVTGIRNYDIEGAVRRETLTATRQLSNNINIQVANELQSEYIKISEHLECRPSHFPWQGKIIKRKNLEKITHYGEVDGLGGINCRHYFEPYYGSARGSKLKKYTQEETEKAYNLSQQQRYLERGVRKWKRKAEMFKSSEDLELYSKAKDKTKEWQLRVKEFTEQNNLKRDFTREYVSEKSNNEFNEKYKALVKESNLKYNIGTQEENIQRCLKARNIQEEIKSKEHLINENKQKKHNIANDNDSYFYISLEEEQELVNKYAGTGIITFTNSGQWNNKEIVSTNKIIGKYINKNYGDTADTNSFVIHYSKKGIHIVPARNRE